MKCNNANLPSVENVIKAMVEYGLYSGIPDGDNGCIPQYLWGSQCIMAACYLMDSLDIKKAAGKFTKANLMEKAKSAMEKYYAKKEEEKVGAQSFTYGELKKAWNELNTKVNLDIPGIVYDIRNGYSMTENRDCCENEWCADWSFEALCEAVKSAPRQITFGDLEVYWNNKESNDADSDGHGIFIMNGKILKVY